MPENRADAFKGNAAQETLMSVFIRDKVCQTIKIKELIDSVRNENSERIKKGH
jgi:hypothetical protein